MKTNYHSHTVYCRHSENEMDKLVQRAIDSGFKVFGISEHMPIPTNKGRTFTDEEFASFLNEYKVAKEKYKDKIQLHLGLECEYHFELYDTVNAYFKMPEIEYLLFGNHFYKSCKDKFKLYDESMGIDILMDQLINLKDALETRMFSCINHPDWFLRYYRKWDYAAKNLTNEMIKASIFYDVPLEFNLNGLYEKLMYKDEWMYPYYDFWKIVSESKAKVIIGVDTHQYQLLSDDVWKKGMEIIESLGLKKNLVKTITFQK
ncbi:MAG: PHP domain-containing protein [Mycoplasma sp.]